MYFAGAVNETTAASCISAPSTSSNAQSANHRPQNSPRRQQATAYSTLRLQSYLEQTMAALGLDDDELKSVEQILSRLAQLSSSIQSLKMDILKSNPLPHPDSLHASAQILQRNLQTVLDSLSENSELFTRIAIHPSTNYPGRTQENVLTQLLRKKLEPDVEELVAEEAVAAYDEDLAQVTLGSVSGSHAEDVGVVSIN
ncbi:hypothetical protein NLG97_g3770 [Lecanicillium saksenae]|uniref:Uncharacterized protein n=1 Tax=Lecanicillium saksenae TaxID=468837 RepID=A0ACC1QYD6_9HYPO|nr:hypothetical protein NLG97_g3770 [Lecanicillium saksenae]